MDAVLDAAVLDSRVAAPPDCCWSPALLDGRGDTALDPIALSLPTKPETSPPTLLDLVRAIADDTLDEGTAGLLFTLLVLVVAAEVASPPAAPPTLDFLLLLTV